MQAISIIQEAFNQIHTLNPKTCDQSIKDAVTQTMLALDKGEIRVSEQKEGQWHVNEWAKQAILL